MGNDEHGPAYPEPPRYSCPVCRGGDKQFITCNHPMCPDGHDQWARDQWNRSHYGNKRKRLVELRYGSPWSLIIALSALIVAAFLASHAFGMDHGFDPLKPTTIWMESLVQPASPPSSCCGIADAYQADTYTRNADGSYTVVITDGSAVEFPDGKHRTPLKDGTIINVPASHVNPPREQKDNPTGHAWVFLSVYGNELQSSPGTVYCFIPLPEGS